MPVPTYGIPTDQEPEFTQSDRNSQFGTAANYLLNQEILNEKSKKLSQAELIRLDLNADFNTVVYEVAGDASRSIILQPKIYVSNSAFGEGLQIQQTEDGNVNLFLSVALSNGLDSKIDSKIIPGEYLVSDKQNFMKALENRLQKKPNFIAEVPCPSQIDLSINGGGPIPVVFHTPMKNCPLNQFFPVQIKLKKEDWKRATDAILDEKEIQIKFEIDLRQPLLVGFSMFTVQEKLVQDWLQSFLTQRPQGLAFPIRVEDLDNLEVTLIAEVQQSFGTAYELSLFSDFKERLKQDFFFEKRGADCPAGSARCFVWNGEALQQQEYTLNLFAYEYFGKSLQIRSASLVQNLMAEPTPFLLKSPPGSHFLPPEKGELNNLFQTVFEGELLELNFQHLRVNELEFEHPGSKYVENPVCIDRGPTPVHEEDDFSHCVDYNQECNQWNDCNRWADQPLEWEADCCRAVSRGGEVCGTHRRSDLNFPSGCSTPTVVKSRHYCAEPTHACVPGHWVNTSCKQYGKKLVPTGEGTCNQWENQWQRITTFSIPGVSSNWVVQDIPLSDLASLTSSLSLHFDLPSPDGMKELDCKLSDMATRFLSDKKLLVVFKNTEKCKPFGEFTRLPGHGPSISMINQYAPPFEYRCGQMTENWKGSRIWTCLLPDGTEKRLESTVADDTLAETNGQRTGLYKSSYPATQIMGVRQILGSYLNEGAGNEN
jgi:hypothetical protein